LINPNNLIEQLDDYTLFVTTLREIDNRMWTASIGEGKWSVRDIVSHIMMWDKNFLDKTLPKLLKQEPVILEEDADVQGFNDQAVEFGKTLTQEELLEKAIFCRSEIVSQLKELPGSTFLMAFSEHNSFTLASFLQNLFVSHDTHHKKQIEVFLVS